MIKNITELNEVNKKLGLPQIKVEVKTIKSTKEYGVPQNRAKKKVTKDENGIKPDVK